MDNEDIKEEEDIVFAYGKNEGVNPSVLFSDFLPEKKEWGAKTRLKDSHPITITALKMLPQMYDEISSFDKIIDEWVESYEKRATSIEGESRKEFIEVFKAMTGKGGSGGESAKELSESIKEAFNHE